MRCFEPTKIFHIEYGHKFLYFHDCYFLYSTFYQTCFCLSESRGAKVSVFSNCAQRYTRFLQSSQGLSWLNPLRARWPMEPALISGCSVKGMIAFDSPWTEHYNPSQVSFQLMLVLIYLPRMDGKLSQRRQKKRLHDIFKYRQRQGLNWVLVVGKQRSYQLRKSQPLRALKKIALSTQG